MLTTPGKTHIKRYMAGYVPAIAQSISFGVGSKAENVLDPSLELETGRAPVNLTHFDFINNKLVFKASIPDDYTGKIYEVGIYSLENDPSAEAASQIITSFNSATEDWLDTAGAYAKFSSTNNRLGADAMNMTPATSGSETYLIRDIAVDLSSYAAVDKLVFAFNCANAFTSQIKFRFLTDSANYYEFSMGAQTAGYKILEFNKSSATVFGVPNWGNITEMQVTTTSNASGSANVEIDAIRIENRGSQNLEYILVARKVITPVTKISGMAQDIEFSLDVTI